MLLKKKLDYERQEDLLGQWLETDSDFRRTRQEAYAHYLEKLPVKHPQFSSLSNQLFMTYTNIVNLITKNAVIATIVMVIALGGMTTAAAQFFAPEEYKPSNILFPQDQKTEIVPKPQINSFEDCENDGGEIIEGDLIECRIDDQVFTKPNENLTKEAQGENSNTEPKPVETQNNESLKTYTSNRWNFQFQYSDAYTVEDNDDSNAPEGYDRFTVTNKADAEKEVFVGVTPEDPTEFMNQFNPEFIVDTQITNQHGITARKIKHNFNYADAGWVPEFTTTEIIFKKDGQFYEISTQDGKICNQNYIDTPDSCEHSKADEGELNRIFQTFRFTDSQLSYTNPFYPDLEINYDSSWKFSTTVEHSETPNVLNRTIYLRKGAGELKFELRPKQVVHNSCIAKLNYSAKETISNSKTRYALDSQEDYFYGPTSDNPVACFSYILQMQNMEQYLTNPNAHFDGELVITFGPKMVNGDLVREADQIVANSKFS